MHQRWSGTCDISYKRIPSTTTVKSFVRLPASWASRWKHPATQFSVSAIFPWSRLPAALLPSWISSTSWLRVMALGAARSSLKKLRRIATCSFAFWGILQRAVLLGRPERIFGSLTALQKLWREDLRSLSAQYVDLDYRIPSLEAGFNFINDVVCRAGSALPVGLLALPHETRVTELTRWTVTFRGNKIPKPGGPDKVRFPVCVWYGR